MMMHGPAVMPKGTTVNAPCDPRGKIRLLVVLTLLLSAHWPTYTDVVVVRCVSTGHRVKVKSNPSFAQLAFIKSASLNTEYTRANLTRC